MKILYLKLTGGYREDYTYQENILPEKMKQLGNEVHLFISTRSKNDDGSRIFIKNREYVNSFGIRIKTIPFKKNKKGLYEKLGVFDNLYRYIESVGPDFIFVHGFQFLSVLTLLRYKKKNRDVTIVADNHLDHIIAPLDTIKRKLLQKVLFRYIAKKLSRVVDFFYGASPLRADYLVKMYKINPAKIKILNQGGDEEIIQSFTHKTERARLCEQLRLDDKKIIVSFGAGNIDDKKRLFPLLASISKNENFELVLFGSFNKTTYLKCKSLLNNRRIHFLGNIKNESIYKIFIASDIAVFPGNHSVLWDQAASCGTPIMVNRVRGMDYFDYGGNCIYLTDGSTEEINNKLDNLCFEKLNKMRIIAETAQKKFWYINIAKKILLTNHIEEQ